MQCNLCLSTSTSLVNFGNFPIAHHYMKTAEQKESTYPFELALCEHCNHVFISNPIPPNILYENYITLSDWKFEPHLSRLLTLFASYNIAKNAKILEVGSNDGKFLSYLRDAGYTNLVGIEPTEDAYLSATKKNIKTIRGFFNEQTTKQYNDEYGQCDLLIIRQVLEHVGDLRYFASCIQKVLSSSTLILIEVPDFESTMQQYDYTTMWEEHINCFTRETLEYFLAEIGVKTIHYEKFIYSGICHFIIGRPLGNFFDKPTQPKNILATKKIKQYAENWTQFKLSVCDFLSDIVSQGKKIAIYGAGVRSAAFVNFNNVAKYIDFVAEDQPGKQNLFMSGSCLEILPSDQLISREINVVLMGVNAENEKKVMLKHSELIKQGVVFYSIAPPSDFLPDFWKEFIHKDNS